MSTRRTSPSYIVRKFAVSLEPADQPHYRDTALSDTTAILKHWAVVALVAAVTLVASIIAVVESELDLFLKVVLAAIGAGVGALIVLGPVVFLATLTVAPHRQRNQARAEVERLRGSRSMLVHEFDRFLAWARTARPRDRGSIVMFAEVGSPEQLANQQSMQEDSQAKDSWRRQILSRYHMEFSAQILALLRQPGSEQLQVDYSNVVTEPKGLDDLEEIRGVLDQLSQAK